jgi:hypothetical protein
LIPAWLRLFSELEAITCDEPPSKFYFNFNLRHYNVEHARRLESAEARGDSLEANMFSSDRAMRQRLVELMGAVREQFEVETD